MTREHGQQVVYAIDVLAAGPAGLNPGCGPSGQPITFVIDGRVMHSTGEPGNTHDAGWDNGRVWRMALRP